MLAAHHITAPHPFRCCSEVPYLLIVRPNRNCVMIMNLYLTMLVRRRFYARGGHLALISHYELWERWIEWRVLYIIGLQRSAIFLSFPFLLCNSFVSTNCFAFVLLVFTHFPSLFGTTTEAITNYLNGCCWLVMAALHCCATTTYWILEWMLGVMDLQVGFTYVTFKRFFCF